MTASGENQLSAEVASAVAYLKETKLAESVSEPVPTTDGSNYRGWYQISCTILPRVPAEGHFPSRVPLQIYVHPAFPFGLIEVYTTGQVSHYAHQSFTGKLCLEPDREAPVDVSRLAWYVSSAKDWLEDAAKRTLQISSDPYELPPFLESSDRPVVFFQEDWETFKEWNKLAEKQGVFNSILAHNKRGIFVTKFFARNSELSHRWGSQVPTDGPDSGIWLLNSRELVTERRKTPSTWGELNSILAENGISLKESLLRYRNKLSLGSAPVLMLVGFPIPASVGGENKELHWQATLIPTWPNRTPGIRQGNTECLVRLALSEGAMSPSKPLRWLDSKNVHPSRFFGRGGLAPEFQKTAISMVGCGALGSAISTLLTRGGLRKMAIWDGDIVQPGNLSRHECYFTDVNAGKARSMSRRLSFMSPHLQVEHYDSMLPLLAEKTAEFDTLRSTDLWFDCTSSERIHLYIDTLARTLGKVVIHTYVTFGAKYICACSGGETTTSEEIHRRLVEHGPTFGIPQDFFELPNNKDLVLEGAGCWHPTFPATWYSMMYLASGFVSQLSRLFPADWRMPWAFVMQNPWPHNSAETITKPFIWFQKFE